MAAFPNLGAQQETNRKILEDLQLKKQLLQKGVSPVAGSITGLISTGLTTAPINNQMPATHFGQQHLEFNQSSSAATGPRSVFTPTSSTTLGFFIPQDSYYETMARLKLKKLEEFLQGVDGFEKPKIKLEQYPTPPHIASCILYNVQSQYEDIEGKLVGDLGSGCGMLSIGSFLLGAQLTIGFEIDSDAIDVFRSNVTEMELPSIDCIQADILHLSNSKWENTFDTIIMNPPFGTKHNAGLDMLFVESGIRMATGAVYSLHKTSTRDYISKKTKEWNVRGEVVAELKYNIEASYKFHKNKSVDIEVDFWRFDVSEKNF